MKHRFFIAAIAAMSLLPSGAQTLNVAEGNVTYSFMSSQTGVMNFSEGSSVNIQGRVFQLGDNVRMYVDDASMSDNLVEVTYSGDDAYVRVAGNVARYVEVSFDGAHVSVSQSDEVGDDTCGEITYVLEGASADGSFTLSGSYKSSIELHGLDLVSATGAAIDIENGKRTALRVQEGTVNSLMDGIDGNQKAALYCKGHLEFKQKGTLNVTGRTAHAISAKEYIEVKNTTINILASKKDGINCNQYFMMESGAISIANTAEDGIQVSFKDAADRDAEDTGSITIKGGTLDIDVTTDAAKALKCEGDFIMSKGTLNATVNGGGIWDSEKLKTKSSSCIGVDGNLDISGGTLVLTATGGGGKGISVNGGLHISGGEFSIATSGGLVAYVNGSINNNYTGNADSLKSDYKSSPKGIKVDGDIVIDGGTFLVETKGKNGEGIESKKTLTINGGDIVIRAYDDGTNSSSHTYINGGNIEITTGAGDAVDSNGNIYVTGGHMVVIGANSPEQGFDAGDGYSIYFTGGEILAGGGGNSVPSNSSQSTQPFVSVQLTSTPGETVTVLDGDTELCNFIVPAKYGTSASAAATRGPGGGGWDWGWGGSGGAGGTTVVSCPEMKAGTSYTVKCGNTTVTGTAALTGVSSGPGGH